ncbi:hypothetical protein, partial [Salinispora arenicola]|uniref:hypothetical protein n=1 Tax=Salinispora arenicola TaxID=168697 RepID=UPI0027DB25ED
MKVLTESENASKPSSDFSVAPAVRSTLSVASGRDVDGVGDELPYRPADFESFELHAARNMAPS